MCKKCEAEPVYILQNQRKLCKSCFIAYFEKKVLKTIRKYGMIDKKDAFAVGLSGGKDSMTLLHIMTRLTKKTGQKIVAVAIDEGIEGYRPKTLEDAKKICKEYNVPLVIASYKKSFGFTLDEYLKKKSVNACAVCGVLRRYLLNKTAREAGATKLATGHNLDDEAQSILMNQFKGNLSLSAKLGPVTGVLKHKKFVPRIKPLYLMLEKETTIYSKLKEFPVRYATCPNFKDNYRREVGIILNTLEAKYRGTKNGIVHAFLEILPKLKQNFRGEAIGGCSLCGEPSAHTICKACEMVKNYATTR